MRNIIRRIDNWMASWPLDSMVAVTMVATGFFIISWPDRGISGYVSSTIGDLIHNPNVSISLMMFFGFTMITCAACLLYNPSPRKFELYSLPIMVYAGMSIPTFFYSMVAQPDKAGTTVVVAWVSYYLLIRWVNKKRVDFIVRKTHASS